MGKRLARSGSCEFLHLTGTVLQEIKYFDISVGDVLRGLDSDKRRFEMHCDHATIDPGNGKSVEVPIRLKVAGTIRHRISWDIALLLETERIDGFGWEPWFCNTSGEMCQGWHRHIWNAENQHAFGKVGTDTVFDGATTFEDFVIRASKEMKVRYNKVDYGNPLLF